MQVVRGLVGFSSHKQNDQKLEQALDKKGYKRAT